MEINKELQNHILEVVENQLKQNNPPEVGLNYKRLEKEGFDDFQIKQMIGQCLTVEMFVVVKEGKEYDNARYLRSLEALPKKPF